MRNTHQQHVHHVNSNPELRDIQNNSHSSIEDVNNVVEIKISVNNIFSVYDAKNKQLSDQTFNFPYYLNQGLWSKKKKKLIKI